MLYRYKNGGGSHLHVINYIISKEILVVKTKLIIMSQKQSIIQSKNDKAKRKLLQNIKSKRKFHIVKKVDELAEITDLKILIFMFDPKQNVLQEFKTSTDFTIDHIIGLSNSNKSVKIDSTFSQYASRNQFPYKNYVQQVMTSDFIKSFPNQIEKL